MKKALGMITYTCMSDFTAQGVNFTKGDKINMTQYIALAAEERRNFREDYKPIKGRK